ncbi:MAG TPA: Asp23/Gls24 family envelope stress response protein [Mycobacteriales bacterium]
MTSPAVQAPGTPDTSGSSTGPGPTAADRRGVTNIADRVVEKIAARAVAEVDLATGTPRQLLGLRAGRASKDTARVDAQVTGNVVTVRITVAVRWPASVVRVTRQVRAHVTERLRTLTGLDVAWVDIDVPVLLAETERGGVS